MLHSCGDDSHPGEEIYTPSLGRTASQCIAACIWYWHSFDSKFQFEGITLYILGEVSHE